MSRCATMEGNGQLSPPLVHFLTETFRTADDLSRSAAVESGLSARCSDLEASLADLGSRLSESVTAYAARSEDVLGLLGCVRNGLIHLRSSVAGVPHVDGGEDRGLERREQILGEELPALAKEVARVEAVRAYAETALKLDSLIGDVEDAVSSSVNGKLRSPNAISSEEVHVTAINSLKNIEDVLISVGSCRPQWKCLVSAADHRVDRALAVLRPQVIAEYRSLLAALGWPPPLSGLKISDINTGQSSELSNPLFVMAGDLKTNFSESFVSLCKLQEVQKRRKYRQLDGYNLATALRQPLWAVEELVAPMTVACQRYFSKWFEKPEFIFTLNYKIARDFLDSMDEVLQPLVDKAMIVGCSCREEWISAIVTSLCTYLSKEIFPQYIHILQDNNSDLSLSPAKLSWLHMVDLMISFDKRIQSFVTNSGMLFSVTEDENLQRFSSLSVFCDRPDWLDIWAEIELGDILEKLKLAKQDEKNWKTRVQATMLMSGHEDYKSPSISGAVLQSLSLLIDRARPLPSIELRAKFIRLAGAPILQDFLDCLLHRCQEAEGLTALADDDALQKVSASINATRYLESILIEWCEGVFFLELENVPDEKTGDRCIFSQEISSLKEFRTAWIDKISTVVLRGFDALCREYLKNKKQWLEKNEEPSLSRPLIGAMDYLQEKISKLEEGLNGLDFVLMWRSLAGGVDQLLFSGIFISSKFNSSGVKKLGNDLEVLYRVFTAWCLRPRGFFPKLSEGLTILNMDIQEDVWKGNERWLREKGIRYLKVAEVEKIVKNKVSM